MASNRSESLVKLAERLRLYSPSDKSSNTVNIQIQNQGPRIQECTINEDPISTTTNNNTRRSKSNTAAVLVCLFEDQQGHIREILTKRASTLYTHSGEVALPGGKVDEGDANDIETALREAEEEIGLDRSLKGVTVIPVVGILWDRNTFNPAINTAEVAAIFDAPLEMFLKDENRREQEREYMGDEYVLQFFDYETENEKYIIWALTAGNLIKAASIVYQRPPDFQERRPKFWSRSCQ